MSEAAHSERAARGERLLRSIIAGSPEASLLAPGFVYEQHFGNTAGSYEGERGLRRWIETFYEVWDRATLEVTGARESAQLLALEILVRVRARQTGIEVEMRATQVFRFSDEGLITRMEAFNEPGEAERLLRLG